jgi:opacity protein-like surface antigen
MFDERVGGSIVLSGAQAPIVEPHSRGIGSMKRLVTALAAGVLAFATNAHAADISMPALPGPVVVAAPAPPPAFDWSRLYVGANVGVWIEFDPISFYAGRVEAIVGKGFTIGQRLVVGAEVKVGFYDFTSPTFEVYGVGRAGVLLGERALVYALGGIGWDNGDWALVGGGGVEVALGAHLSLRGETMLYWGFGDGLAPGYVSLTGGLAWRFGR